MIIIYDFVNDKSNVRRNYFIEFIVKECVGDFFGMMREFEFF